MKPVKITMTAFGPYKDQEVVDFTKLNEHKLFVISGNTGAGKTTIFDAISFALYGSASGEDRNEIKMLRSDFADDDVYTSVELEFELKGRMYRVLRQMAHVKEGNKTATGDKYEFFEVKNGKDIPLTDRFIVSQVDEKIKEIIGLSKEQFCQILMLPQGEFRKLLTSDTEDKEEILRRIFKTNFYKSVAEHLNQKRRNTQKQYDEEVKARDIYIQHVKSSLPEREGAALYQVLSQEHFNTHQVIQALDEEIKYYQELMSNKKKELDLKTKLYQEKNKEFLHAQALNERFDQLEMKKMKMIELEEQSEKMKDKKEKLQLGEKASHLQVYENYKIELEKEVVQRETEKELAYKEQKASEEHQKSAKKIYEREEQNTNKREQVVIELQQLREIEPVVQALDKQKQRITKFKEQVTTYSSSVNELERNYKEKHQEKTIISNQLRSLEEKVRTLPKKMEDIANLREKVTVLKDYIKLKETARTDLKTAKQEKDEFEKIEQEFQRLEVRWIEGQASILATHLHDGEACSVCGSKEHPNKASLREDIPSKEELDQKRQEKRKVELHYNEAQAKANASIEQVVEKKGELIQLGFNPEEAETSYKEITAQGKNLKVEIDNLSEESKKLDKQRKTYEIVEQQLEHNTKSLNETTVLLNEAKSAYQTEQALYERDLTKVPEALRSIEALHHKISELERSRKRLEDAWRHAQQEYQSANEKLATTTANLDHAMKALRSTVEKEEKASKEFKEAAQKAGFDSIEAYQHAKLTSEEIEKLKLELEAYNDAMKTLAVQIKDLNEELEKKERSNLDVLKTVLDKLEHEVESIRLESQHAQSYYEKATNGKSNIISADEDVQGVEQELQLIKELYEIVSGQNNKKISFERYLQIEFLEQIIQAANERLKKLSNGQFFLVRSERLEKRGKQSGLGLDVLDNYTGQFRDVKTLSGGEKFNASLCLALGMVDVIQEYEGGISIETMFIDEGFGSLDEESLNKAIDTLIDLQQTGRMIGVISHVQELKQAIPAILEVRKKKEGYSETRFVIS